MKRLLTVLLLCLSIALPSTTIGNYISQQDPIKLLVVTGGSALRSHIDLVPTSFYTLFTGYENLVWTHATYDEAAFQSEALMDFDVILLYNRSDSISDISMNRLRQFVESGKGLVVLHHALGSYNNWEWWWKEVVGGKYQMVANEEFPKSDYKQGETIAIAHQKDHPVTKAVGSFELFDETYKELWISDEVDVLYRTDNPTSDGPVVWISPFEASNVIVIQPGHAESAHTNPDYKNLIFQAISWANE